MKMIIRNPETSGIQIVLNNCFIKTNFESPQHLDSNNTSPFASSQSNYERLTNNENRLPSISDMMSESMA